MTTMHDLVFLFDVDNTLLDNDRVQADLATPAARMTAATCRTYAAFSTAPLTFRRAAMISATIAMPISAGLAAPMASPTGLRICASSASEKPAARIRSRRRAWVILEPSAPI
jgi:hypothetical protein